MFSSTAAAAAKAMIGASHRAQTVTGFELGGRLAANMSGQSEEHRSSRESPRRGAFKTAQDKRACEGGREVRIRVSDGPAMDRSGRRCSIMVATGLAQRGRAGCPSTGDFMRAG